jgi:hypothetical protein
MPSAIQRSFAGGEIAPALYGRADQAKYQTGLKTCRNFIVKREGGVTNRTGTQYINDVADSSWPPRLLKFVFNQANSYALEIGDLYIRFYKNGARIGTGIPAPWNSITTYSQGNLVVHAGVDYYSLQDNNLNNQPDVSPTWWYPMPAGILEVPSPFRFTEVEAIQTAQTGDTMVLVHPSHPPQELKWGGDTDWVLNPITFRPTVARPAGCSGSGTAGTSKAKYRVTAVDRDTGEESLPGLEAAQTILGVTKANPAVVTVSGTGAFNDGADVFIENIVGMTELNDRTFLIANVTVAGPNTTFELVGEDSTNYTTYTSGGSAYRAQINVDNIIFPVAANPVTLLWTAVANSTYRIYRRQDGVFGLIGTATEETFVDSGITPQASVGHPIDFDVFLFPDDYPSTVTFHQQRLWFANTNNNPELVLASRIGFYYNFSLSSPVTDSDIIEFTVASQQVNEVRALLSLGDLVLFTSQSEWVVQGDQDGVITPTAINLRQQGFYGSSEVRPTAVGNVAVFIQARGQSVRDLRFSNESGGYVGRELSIFGSHLFSTVNVVTRLDMQVHPFSTVWIVQDSGRLLGLTYMPEHEVWGWHRHDTDGDDYVDVVVIPEGNEDVPYVLVNRAGTYAIEFMASREINDIVQDGKFVDSFLSYDGTNLTLAGYDPIATMILTGGVTWAPTETLTLTASANTFAAGNVGDEVFLYSGADFLRVSILAYTSPTVVSVQPQKTVPASLRAIATAIWALAVDTFSGLSHLEGRTVNGLGDGHVMGAMVVSSGSVTAPRPFAIAHIGLPIVADMETLPLTNVGGETFLDKKMRVNRIMFLFEESRGGWAGPDEDHLTEIQESGTGGYDNPIPLVTGKKDIRIDSTWGDEGQIFYRQQDPIPATVLAVAPGYVSGG